MSKPLNLSQLRSLLRRRLLEAGIEEAALEVTFIVEFVTGLDRSQQIINAQNLVKRDDCVKAESIIKRRLTGEPLDHIFGFKEFYGLRFEVNSDVLSPRPETEMLVDFVLEKTSPESEFKFADLGTGSGAIAVSVLVSRPLASGLAIDVSNSALKIAQSNANRLIKRGELRFLQTNWLDNVTESFDFIVSNPPYIDARAMTELSIEVKKYDPELALSGGDDGLAAYREISDSAVNSLKSDGYLVFEIGYDQGPSVSNILKTKGYSDIRVYKDLAGHDRMVTGRLKQ